MDIYKQAVEIANKKNKWKPHPTREDQEICLVKDLEMFWTGEDDEVKINACVVRKEKGPGNYEYYVFMTTNILIEVKEEHKPKIKQLIESLR
ncbi:hypothetical protein C4577_06280 [Candidatus Parcubacteria bacterium]|nr:MAG: hypothetical protein C4577_06280 [Candidatus Parcubacteria bacterium]